MRFTLLLSIIAVPSILLSSCSASQSTIETAVAETMTALPSMTLRPTATLTPFPTKTATATSTPSRRDLVFSIEQIQSVFESYGFKFELIRLAAGETVMEGSYNEDAVVYLTSQGTALTRVDYRIPVYVNIDEVPIPSLGDIVFEVLGEDVYETKFIPWAMSKSGGFEESLCFDGILIKSYYSEWSESRTLTIMLEHEWDEEIGGCS